MDREEALKLLRDGKEGVWKWNLHRGREIPPSLSGADLGGADLSGANLIQAHLSAADLSMANLSEANLMQADLSETNLSRADLRGAKLIEADLSNADLSRADLSRADLSRVVLLGSADLSMANFSGASLNRADLSEADLRGANLCRANLCWTKLIEADLRGAKLVEANLSGANFERALLGGADLQRSLLIETNFRNAKLSGCSVYGVSAWNVALEGAEQGELVISRGAEPIISVDHLEVAQFVYLLLNNKRVREVIDTITSKVVLILGRFTAERKSVLDAIRDELRKRGYCPVLFDFEKPASRNLTETVSTLAHMAKFIIADISEPRSIPNELRAVVPNLRVPVVPLLVGAETAYGMFSDFEGYPWVLAIVRYGSLEDLLRNLGDGVISPAEAKVKELQIKPGGERFSS